MVNPPHDPGAGIVQRGLVLLALMLLVVAGGYFLILRRVQPVLPERQLDPAVLVSLLAEPVAIFPASLSWGTMLVFTNQLPSQSGWEVRYTAASSLARRGSAAVPWEVVQELLDENRQFRNFRVRLHDGRLVPDEAAARHIILQGLQAVAQWHKKQAPDQAQVSPQLLGVYAAVDRLAHSPVLEVRTQAEKTRTLFFRK